MPFEGGIFALDPPEVNGGRVRRGLERLEGSAAGRLGRALRARDARLLARIDIDGEDAREADELLLDVDEARLDLGRRVGVVSATRVAELLPSRGVFCAPVWKPDE